MPKPLILIGSLYHDAASLQFLKKLFIELRCEEYQRLCVEMPKQLTQEQILNFAIQCVTSTEQSINAVIYLTHFWGNQEQLSQLSFNELLTLVKPFFSDPNDIAMSIQSLPAYKENHRILAMWVEMGGTLHGIDSAELTTKAQGLPINQRCQYNKQTAGLREEYVANEIKLNLNSQQGTVAFIGIKFLAGVLAHLQAQSINPAPIIVFPHTGQWCGNSIEELGNLCVELPQNIIRAQVDTKAQQQNLIARVMTQLQGHPHATQPEVAPIFTPLAQAQLTKTNITPQAEKNEGLNFMRGAFKKGF